MTEYSYSLHSFYSALLCILAIINVTSTVNKHA